MSKDANSFGHDKALAWESRGFVYTKRGCIVSTHPHPGDIELHSNRQIFLFDKSREPHIEELLPSP